MVASNDAARVRRVQRGEPFDESLVEASDTMATVHGRLVARALFLAAAIAIAAGATFAQTEMGKITGTIMRSGGEKVAKAKIEARNIQTGLRRKTSSGDNGVYSMPNLKPGVYDVTVTADGAPTRKQRVRVTVGTPSRLDFEIGSAGAAGTPAE
jgi:hypothetical protein